MLAVDAPNVLVYALTSLRQSIQLTWVYQANPVRLTPSGRDLLWAEDAAQTLRVAG